MVSVPATSFADHENADGLSVVAVVCNLYVMIVVASSPPKCAVAVVNPVGVVALVWSVSSIAMHAQIMQPSVTGVIDAGVNVVRVPDG